MPSFASGAPGVGARVRALIERSGRTKAEIARRAQISRQTLYDAMEKDRVMPDVAPRLARALDTSVEILLGAEPMPEVVEREPFVPNPRFRKRLPPRAYATVYGYLKQMEDAGASLEQLDEAERVMVDGAYNKLNSRDVRDRTEEEMIMDIDAAWAFIRDVLRDEGMKLR